MSRSCPSCLASKVETTTMGILIGLDTNKAHCLACGWEGLAFQLLPPPTEIFPFQEAVGEFREESSWVCPSCGCDNLDTNNLLQEVDLSVYCLTCGWVGLAGQLQPVFSTIGDVTLRTIVLNGAKHSILGTKASYSDLVQLAGKSAWGKYRVTWRTCGEEPKSGVLSPKETLELVDNMSISVTDQKRCP